MSDPIAAYLEEEKRKMIAFQSAQEEEARAKKAKEEEEAAAAATGSESFVVVTGEHEPSSPTSVESAPTSRDSGARRPMLDGAVARTSGGVARAAWAAPPAASAPIKPKSGSATAPVFVSSPSGGVAVAVPDEPAAVPAGVAIKAPPPPSYAHAHASAPIQPTAAARAPVPQPQPQPAAGIAVPVRGSASADADADVDDDADANGSDIPVGKEPHSAHHAQAMPVKGKVESAKGKGKEEGKTAVTLESLHRLMISQHAAILAAFNALHDRMGRIERAIEFEGHQREAGSTSPRQSPQAAAPPPVPRRSELVPAPAPAPAPVPAPTQPHPQPRSAPVDPDAPPMYRQPTYPSDLAPQGVRVGLPVGQPVRTVAGMPPAQPQVQTRQPQPQPQPQQFQVAPAQVPAAAIAVDSGSGSGSEGRTSDGRKVKFDENLIRDLISFGYPRDRIVMALTRLFERGSPTDNVNMAIDELEKM